MSTELSRELSARLSKAYDEIMHHASAAIGHVRNDTLPGVRHVLDGARDKVVAMGSVTSKEADKVTGYIQRDLVHAAEYLESTRRDLSDWLRFDIELLEQGVAQALRTMVDHTRETLDELAATADAIGWKTGEIVGPGTLHCKNCRQVLHFHATGHVPPCPKCKHTLFARDHEIG